MHTVLLRCWPLFRHERPRLFAHREVVVNSEPTLRGGGTMNLVFLPNIRCFTNVDACPSIPLFPSSGIGGPGSSFRCVPTNLTSGAANIKSFKLPVNGLGPLAKPSRPTLLGRPVESPPGADTDASIQLFFIDAAAARFCRVFRRLSRMRLSLMACFCIMAASSCEKEDLSSTKERCSF